MLGDFFFTCFVFYKDGSNTFISTIWLLFSPTNLQYVRCWNNHYWILWQLSHQVIQKKKSFFFFFFRSIGLWKTLRVLGFYAKVSVCAPKSEISLATEPKASWTLGNSCHRASGENTFGCWTERLCLTSYNQYEQIPERGSLRGSSIYILIQVLYEKRRRRESSEKKVNSAAF